MSKICLHTAKKYTLWDDAGNVVMDLDDVMFNEYFVAMKKDGIWKIARLSDGFTKHIYEAKDVMLYEEVLWYKKNGVWSAVDVDGNILVKANYDSIKAIGKGLIEVRTRGTWHTEYFSVKGKILSDQDTITCIYTPYLKYAMALGYKNDSDSKQERYYIVNVDEGTLSYKSFMDEESCAMLLNELRNDLVWSN